MNTKRIRSAVPIYITALFWLLYGLALPIYRPLHLLVAACLSVVTFAFASKFFPGRVVELPARTGDKELDRQLAEGRALLDSLKALNAEIPDEGISRQLDRMDAAGRQIFAAVEKELSRAGQVRKFLNYYLPTTEKLVASYRELKRVSSPGEHVRRAMASVESSLSLVADAFEKQLDNLYRADALDITADVDVLETMIASEGLTREGVSKIIVEDTTK